MSGTDTITIINAIKDSRGSITAYQNTVLPGVHIEQKTAVSISSADRSSLRDTLVMIWRQPVEAAGLTCVSPEALAAAEKRDALFALTPGDYAVPGECTEVPEAGASLRDFIRKYHLLEITAVEDCLYGSLYLQHWEVTMA